MGVENTGTGATPTALAPSLLGDDESVVCGSAMAAVDMLVTLLQEDHQVTPHNNHIITPTFLLTTARQTSLAIRESAAYKKQLKLAKKQKKTGATPSDNISPAGLLEGTLSHPLDLVVTVTPPLDIVFVTLTHPLDLVFVTVTHHLDLQFL